MEALDSEYIYRFRPYSPSTCKEIMYNEMYFYSKDEINDPFDLSIELVISKGNNKVLRYFIEGAFRGSRVYNEHQLQKEDSILAIEASKYLMSDDQPLKKLIDDNSKDFFFSLFDKHKIQGVDFTYFWKNFSNILQNLHPNNLHGVSFTKNYKNMLLWSLYANKHEGFCEIFKPSKNTLKLKKWNKKGYKDFEFLPVEYNADKKLDISLMFDSKGDLDTQKLFSEYLPNMRRKAYLIKSNEWGREEELRLFEDLSINFSSMEQKKDNSGFYNQLYYFHEEQLAGVILGANMHPKNKAEILEILQTKSHPQKVFQAIPNGNEVVVVLDRIFSNGLGSLDLGPADINMETKVPCS